MIIKFFRKKLSLLKNNNIFFYDSFKFWNKYIINYPKNYKLVIVIFKLFIWNLKELYFHFFTNFRYMKFYHPWQLNGYSKKGISGSRPTSYSLANIMINQVDKIDITKNFLDIGCGNGFILHLASKKKFNSIYGVEKNKKVFSLIKNNSFLKKKTKIKNKDFFDYVIPPDVNIIYFFSPIKYSNIKLYKKFYNKIINFSKRKKDFYIITKRLDRLKYFKKNFKEYYSYQDPYIKNHKFVILKNK